MNDHRPLELEPNLWQPDDFYAALIETHQDLNDAQSQLVNAKLVLLLANHIGDRAVLMEALQIARDDLE
ncbi:MAG TPA: DUF2783 domain-containing protein [Sedimenticola thiotaurini]|uniref:DUF2783 domain-containing protein n=1 Tax=Sedimenticola thiotaurini TaxID=1543721 RepID=A0A831RNU9_9GAMM|nr:DUF2783 domain-containing protein [Sedimenticola thiotaurini]